MNSRTLIAAAVAAACTWPTLATAAREGFWSVNTPSSVDESAPWKAAERNTQVSSTRSFETASSFSEVTTPLSVSESAPWQTPRTTRARSNAQMASLANPQTPWSPNESAPARYREEMRARAQEVASVEQARIEIARLEAERIAAVERERLAAIERERAAAEAAAAAQSTTPENAAVGATGSPDNNTAAAATGTQNAPATPAEPRAQRDQNAGLVDTRGDRGLSVSTNTMDGGTAQPSNNTVSDVDKGGSAVSAASPATEPPATSAAIPPSLPAKTLSNAEGSNPGVGVTPSQGASASGTGPSVTQSAPAAASDSVGSSAIDRAQPPSVNAAAPSTGHSQNAAQVLPGTADSNPANAYVTMHESAVEKTTR